MTPVLLQDLRSARQASPIHPLQSNSNSTLVEGQKLLSQDKSHALVMQGDGNLVCYNGGFPVWTSQTYSPDTGPFQSVMQEDRSAVICGAIGTDRHGVAPSSLVMQDDCTHKVVQTSVFLGVTRV